MFDSSKKWYKSKTIWSSITQIVIGIGCSVGLVSTDVGQAIQEDFPALAVTLGETAVGAVGLYGRVKARTKITR